MRREIVNDLIKRKILDDKGDINKISYLLIRAIKQYKMAKRYIRINDILAGLDDSNFLVMIRRKENNRIDIKKVTKETLIFSIIKEYEFLQKKYDADRIIKKIDSKYFFAEILQDKENSQILSLRVENEKGIFSHLFYYEENNILFRYDVLKEELRNVNSKEARLEIAQILEFGKEDSRDE